MLDILDADLPNLVQMDASVAVEEICAERLLSHVPGHDKVFFCETRAPRPSGRHIKLSRAATRRSKLVFLRPRVPRPHHGVAHDGRRRDLPRRLRPFAGRRGARPRSISAALEAALNTGNDVAAFNVETDPRAQGCQHAGRRLPSRGRASIWRIRSSCHRRRGGEPRPHRQVPLERARRRRPGPRSSREGFSRGGYVSVGAVIGKKWIFDRTFDRMERCRATASTCGTNNRAGDVTVLEDEGLVENAAVRGEHLLRRLGALVREVRAPQGRAGAPRSGALEFGAPSRWRCARPGRSSKYGGLFCQIR